MKQAIVILLILVFGLVYWFVSQNAKFYELQWNLYGNLKVYQYSVVNNLDRYITCSRTTGSWVTLVWYCWWQNKPREMFMPNYLDINLTTSIVRSCWSTAPNCKDMKIDKWLRYFENGSILGCQYWIEGRISPNMVWGATNNQFLLQIESLDWATIENDFVTVTGPLVSATEQEVVKSLLWQICINGYTDWKCLSSPRNVFNHFNWKSSIDWKSLYISLKDPRYQINSITFSAVVGPSQTGTTRKKEVLNFCGS